VTAGTTCRIVASLSHHATRATPRGNGCRVATLEVNVLAQQTPALAPPYKVTPLLKGPVTGDPNKETVMIRVDWPPNVSTGRHTHPDDEYGTVLEGTLISQDEGGDWKTYNVGESYHKVMGVGTRRRVAINLPNHLMSL
jgi:quercetin dioxygenase-like cupin family protein